MKPSYTIPALILAFIFILALPISQGSNESGPENPGDITGETVTLKIDPGPLAIETEVLDGIQWTRPRLEDCIYPPADGGPSVPVISYPLRVPYDIRSIRVERKDPEVLHLSLPVAPSARAVHLTEEVLTSGEATGLDLDWSRYLNGGTYPAEKVRWAHMGYGWEEGEKLSHYSVSVSPFEHDPMEQTLTFYRDIDLVIEKEPEVNYITRAVEKPDSVKEGTELLIISYDPFVNDLEQYVEWKKQTGMTVTVMQYSNVNGEYSSLDGTRSIWQFVHDTFFGDEKNLKYVLLMGEPKYVPTLMAWDQDPYGSEPNTLPADTYFACLDGDYNVWNRDGDDRWGETNDIQDHVPDVYVSRVSADNDNEVLNWAKKVVNYEKNPAIGDWSSKVGLFGSTTHSTDDGPTQCEYYWNDYLRYVYQTPDKYYSSGSVQSQTGAKVLNYQNINSGFNSGLSSVVYMGHGLANVWSEGTQQSSQLIFTTNEAEDLRQSPKLPFISAMSCETNWFDNGNWDSISEEFIENGNGGAIGYAGASRTTEGGIGYAGDLPGAPGIQQGILLKMSEGYRSQGEIFHEGKESYVDEWGAYFNQQQWIYNAWLEHNLLGSPETRIWTEEISTLSVTVDYVNDHFSNFTVTVKDGSGDPVENAKAAVYSSTLGSVSVGETNGQGVAVIPFEISGPAYGFVTVTKDDFKPFQNEYYLTDETPPRTTITYEQPYPDGDRGWYRNDPGIGFRSNEPGTIHYKWNGGQAYEYDGEILIPKGENTLKYWTEDLSENLEEEKSAQVKYDPDTPILSYTVTPSSPDGIGGWYSTLPVIETSITGTEASPQRVEYWWGRGSKEVSNGTIYALQGDNELHLQAVDDAGNRDEEVIIEFLVDSIYPEVEIYLGNDKPNPLGWYVEPMVIELTCKDRTADIYYSWDGGAQWSEYDDPFEPPAGNHTLVYYAVDAHGNEGPTGSITIPYDISVPKVGSKMEPSSPDGLVGWYTTQPLVTLSTEGDEGETIYYRIDNGPEQVYTTPIVIPEGEHTLHVRSIDRAGNEGSKVQYHFKVDTREEETTFSMDSSPNSEGIISDVPMIYLRTSEDAIIYYSWTGSDFTAYNGAVLPPGDEGEFVLFFYSMDEAGNKEETRSRDLIIDAKGPEVVATGPVSAKAGEEVLFDLSRTTDGMGVEEYFVDFGDGSDSGWVSNPSISHKYGSGGTYEVRIKARDSVGHESEEKVLTIEISEDPDNTLLYLGLGAAAILVIVLLAILLAFALTKKKQHYMHTHPIQRPPAGRPPHPNNRQVNSGQMSRINQPHPSKIDPQSPPGNINGRQNIPAPQKPVQQPNKAPVPPPPRMPEIPQPPEPPI